MVNDPIGDLLIQIKNAGMAGKPEVVVPFSRLKLSIAKILAREGYIGNIEKVGSDPKSMLRISLQYNHKVHAISDVKRRSKPGLRIYVKKDEIPVVVGGLGSAILSTPKGIMTGREAKKLGIGGELLCEVW